MIYFLDSRIRSILITNDRYKIKIAKEDVTLGKLNEEKFERIEHLINVKIASESMPGCQKRVHIYIIERDIV